jgi:hypothetical protein
MRRLALFHALRRVYTGSVKLAVFPACFVGRAGERSAVSSLIHSSALQIVGASRFGANAGRASIKDVFTNARFRGGPDSWT